MTTDPPDEMEVIDVPLLELGEAAVNNTRKYPTFREEFGVDPKWAVALLILIVVFLFGIIIWLGITRLA
jgi:hypothetical protein